MTQSNLAVAVGASTAAQGATITATASQAAVGMASALPSIPLPDVPPLTSIVTETVDLTVAVAVASAPPVEERVDAIPTVSDAQEWLDDQLDLTLLPGVAARFFVLPSPELVQGRLPLDRAPLVPAVGSTAALRIASLPRTIGALTSGEATGPRAGGIDRGAGRPAARPRWHAPVPESPPESAPSPTSAAPATGGGSSGGGIPVFLALPFLAAMLDLARHVVPFRTALPSGHRGRMPDDPG